MRDEDAEDKPAAGEIGDLNLDHISTPGLRLVREELRKTMEVKVLEEAGDGGVSDGVSEWYAVVIAENGGLVTDLSGEGVVKSEEVRKRGLESPATFLAQSFQIFYGIDIINVLEKEVNREVIVRLKSLIQ